VAGGVRQARAAQKKAKAANAHDQARTWSCAASSG
jgi:hypothetical protein